MSRCFPFPPPGYEAKLRSEHKDLLKKEKHKAKKHKKATTDEGKRERKEKDRDHRKDKHKKHKREKHKDRSKKKERDKDKRQNSEQGTQKNADLDNRKPKQIVHNEAVKDSKHKDELASKITGQGGHANNTGSSAGKLLPRSVESFGVVCSKEKEITSVSGVNEKSGQIGQHNHGSGKGKDKTRVLNGTSLQGGLAEKHSTGIHGSNGIGLQYESSKGVLATTAATQQKSRITPNTNAAERTEQVEQHSVGSSHSVYEKTDSMSTKRMTDKKNGSINNFHFRMDKQLVRGKNEAVQGSAKIKEEKANHQKGIKNGDRCYDITHNAVKGRDRDHNVKKRKDKDGKNGAVQGNARIKEVNTNHQKSVKDGDRGHDVNHKTVKDRDRDHSVEKRKAKDGNKGKDREKRSVGYEQNGKELDGHGDGASKNYILEMDLVLNGNKFTSDNVKKRKDFNTNSSLHEHSMLVTKMPRTSPANHLCVNGETLKHSRGTSPCSSKLPVATNPCEADMGQDNKEWCDNGIVGPHYLEEHKSSVSSSNYGSSEVSLTPPHPDTKYLSQVYSIPAVDDCSDYIDQDWLFSGDHAHQKQMLLEAAEAPQVWAAAQPIDSADVVAMPYVVPL